MEDLSVWFDDPARPAVDRVSLSVDAGRTLALVGEIRFRQVADRHVGAGSFAGRRRTPCRRHRAGR